MDLLFAYLQCTGQSSALDAHSEYSQGSFDAAHTQLKKFITSNKSADCCGLLFAQTLMACISVIKDDFPKVEPSIQNAELQLRRVLEFPDIRSCAKSEEQIAEEAKEQQQRSKDAQNPSLVGSGGGRKNNAAAAAIIPMPPPVDPAAGVVGYFNEIAFTHYTLDFFKELVGPMELCLRWLKDYRVLYGNDQHHKLMASCEIVRNGAKFSYDRQLIGCIGVNVPVITWLRGVLHNCLSTVTGMTSDTRYLRQKTIYDDIYRTATKFPSPGGATLPFVGDKNLKELEVLAYFQLPWPMALVPAGRLPYIVVLLQALSKLVQAELLLCVFKDKSCLNIALEVQKMSVKLEKKVNGQEPELNDLFTTIRQQVVAMATMSGTHHRPTFDSNYPQLSALIAKTPLTNADAVPVECLQRLAEKTLLSAYDAYSRAMQFDGHTDARSLKKKYGLLSTVIERCKTGLRTQVQANFKYQKLTIEDTDGRFSCKLLCMKGFAEYHSGDRLAALSSFRTAIRYHPFCFEAFNQLTNLYLTPAPQRRTEIHVCDKPSCTECAAERKVRHDADDFWSCSLFPWEEYDTTRLRFPPGSEEYARLSQQLHVLRLHQRRLEFQPTATEMNETSNSIFDFVSGETFSSVWLKEPKLIEIERLMLPAMKQSDADFERDQKERLQLASLVAESDKTKKKFDADLSGAKERTISKEKELTKLKDQRKKLQSKTSAAREGELTKLSKELQSLTSKEKRARLKANENQKNSAIHQNKLEATVSDVSAALVKLQSESDDMEDEYLQWENDSKAEFVALVEALTKPPPPAPVAPMSPTPAGGNSNPKAGKNSQSKHQGQHQPPQQHQPADPAAPAKKQPSFPSQNQHQKNSEVKNNYAVAQKPRPGNHKQQQQPVIPSAPSPAGFGSGPVAAGAAAAEASPKASATAQKGQSAPSHKSGPPPPGKKPHHGGGPAGNSGGKKSGGKK